MDNIGLVGHTDKIIKDYFLVDIKSAAAGATGLVDVPLDERVIKPGRHKRAFTGRKGNAFHVVRVLLYI